MKIDNPIVSVLMPVYNCEAFIELAVNSILNQSFRVFELLLIDDCSTDATVEIVSKISDSRITIIQKSENSGYTNSLNQGLKLAKGIYIARMDGDDISHPKRFEKQIQFLEQNTDYVICGSNYRIIDTDKIITLPEFNDAIRLTLLSYSCMAHPSVMFRKKIIDDNSLQYDKNKEPAEDYDLWSTLVQYGKIYNIQEPLLDYRVHENQVSQLRIKRQISSSKETKLKLISYVYTSFTEDELVVLDKCISTYRVISSSDINLFYQIKVKLLKGNTSLQFYQEEGFRLYLKRMEIAFIRSYFLQKKHYNPSIFFEFISIKSKYNLSFPVFDIVKLFVKSTFFLKNKSENKK